MAELILERNQRLALRAEAHHLSASVLLGDKGFTDAVLKEIDRVLGDHGLVKVHVPSDDREERQEIYMTVADKLGAARIQMIGKMLVFYRPPKDKEKEAEKELKRTQDIKFGVKQDKGARGIRRPGSPKKKKDEKRVIIARKKHKHLTKKAALS